MKSKNIIKRLENEGYNIIYKKWGYWHNIPHVQLDGFSFTIAEYVNKGGWLGCNLDFIFNQVRHALNLAQMNNPVILKKIKESPSEEWYYLRYIIRSMEDYFLYKKNIYPFNNGYSQILEKLKNEK